MTWIRNQISQQLQVCLKRKQDGNIFRIKVRRRGSHSVFHLVLASSDADSILLIGSFKLFFFKRTVQKKQFRDSFNMFCFITCSVSSPRGIFPTIKHTKKVICGDTLMFIILFLRFVLSLINYGVYCNSLSPSSLLCSLQSQQFCLSLYLTVG